MTKRKREKKQLFAQLKMCHFKNGNLAFEFYSRADLVFQTKMIYSKQQIITIVQNPEVVMHTEN